MLSGPFGSLAQAQVPERIVTECEACEGESVYAADVDGDGDTDLLSASYADDQIAWYENDGTSDPSFTLHEITTSADGTESVHAADVDGDGHTDILSASEIDDTIAWYENDGASDPSFTTHEITTSAGRPETVYAADVDGNGHTDIVSATNRGDKVVWYENDGASDPSFTKNEVSTNVDGTQSVYAADVDGDDDTDILSASENDDTIAWHENDGTSDPGFTTNIINNGANGARGVYATDVDGDGNTDVLSASSEDDKIVWYENDGTSDPSFTTNTITSSADNANDVYATDVNGDGHTDVLSSSSGDDTIAWYENDGSETFTTHTTTTNALGVQSVHAADIDGDTYTDILSASYMTVAWHENDGNASPSFGERALTGPAFVDGPRDVHAADVDGDDDTDLLSASSQDDQIAWYENDGSGTFTPHTITTNAEGAIQVHAADVDGDDDTDILSASNSDDTVAWYENEGTSDPSFTTHEVTTTAGGAASVYAADVDGNGHTDVLAASYSDDTVAWYENDGTSDPGFTLHEITSSADGAASVYATDVDGDGHTDVLSASILDNAVRWYENDGSGTFTSHTITTNAEFARSVYAADVDGDGHTDILSASEIDDTIAWHENDGTSDPSFTTHEITTSADGAWSVYAADVDGDGDTDVLSASDDDNTIAWYENDGTADPGFTGQVITTEAKSARGVHAADVDGDADSDVLSASYTENKIAWYENTDSTLPVELAGFEGMRVERGVRLTWQTASEENNAGFRVQRRAGEAEWTKIGRVEGAGTTSEAQSYRFTDADLPFEADTLEYRLKQVDTDGSTSLTDPVTVARGGVERLQLKGTYPNPARGQATVRFAVPEEAETESVEMRLYDVLGRQVRTVKATAEPGRHELELDVSGLGSGTYFLRLQDRRTTTTQKMTVVR